MNSEQDCITDTGRTVKRSIASAESSRAREGFTFNDPRTGKPISVEQAANANTYPHVEAAWCHCAKCSNHAEYIYDLARRMREAEARLAAR